MSDTLIIDTMQQAFGQPNNSPQGGFICSGKGLVDLLKDKGDIVGLEIGSDVGDTAHYLLSQLPGLYLHSVDPYVNYVDWNGRDLNERQSVYEGLMDRLKIYSARFQQHRKYSDDAVVDFYENQFDFIFIDGLHTYEQLTKDCANYYKFLKPGGVFAGHDYHAIEGVKRAADEFAVTANKQISIVPNDVWWWVK